MIDKLAYVHPDAKIGKDVEIMPFAFVGPDTEIGDNCVIMSYSAVLPGTVLGRNNRVHGHTMLGVDPQDFNYKGDKSKLIIGNDNDIRENVVIARGIDKTSATRIGNSNHIMEKVHICHDAEIHNSTVLGIAAIIGANSLVENEVIITNQVVIMNDCRVGRRSLIQSGCRVQKDVPPYIVTNGNPVEYHGVNTVILKHFKTSERIMRHIANAYRLIFHGDTSLEDAVLKIEEQIPPSEEILNIETFIRGSKLGIIQCKY